ncbi:MAG: hypothetical protein CMB89_05150 [Flammeovirgaceae bacterium]|nr:hypothetical protein [Flammeovirgaceae bacterium]
MDKSTPKGNLIETRIQTDNPCTTVRYFDSKLIILQVGTILVDKPLLFNRKPNHFQMLLGCDPQ